MFKEIQTEKETVSMSLRDNIPAMCRMNLHNQSFE